MRVMTWNCAGGFHRKAPPLLAQSPDIAVIQEVLEKDTDALGLEYDAYWIGRPGSKGLLIAAKPQYALSITATTKAPYLAEFAASTGCDTLFGTAVWSVPEGARNYLKTVCDGLDELGQRPPTDGIQLMLGDFNASPVFDAKNTKINQFSHLQDRMKPRRLESLWHYHSRESLGQETTATFFLYRHQNKPYHLDYIFGCEAARTALTAIEIGKHADWCAEWSDHVPIIADFQMSD